MHLLYRDQKDSTLVMLTLAGEQRAYETLVVRYQKAVIAAANRVIQNPSLAEDAAQDAFVTAWMKLNLLREPEKYGAWVCRIAKNCAKNMVIRFRSFLSLEVLENCASLDEHSTAAEDPGALYVSSEEKQLLHESIDGLPARVREVIRLHYFEGLSIAEIADRMRISEGTVKWQLHDGRKRIRKELSAMNEQENDSLLQRVMKKVEELKLWQRKNSKNGFDKVYRDVLSEVERLPESKDKYHALSDVLMRGWWWLPGDQNDALFARIKEAAEQGKNDEVMSFIVSREDEKLYGSAKLAFIRDKQIPRLEAGGYKKALAREWFWLSKEYFGEKDVENGVAAMEKALSLLEPSDLYYALALAALEMEKRTAADYREKDRRSYLLRALGEEYRFLGGKPCRCDSNWYGRGTLCSTDIEIDFIFRNATLCDGEFTRDGMAVGETYVASDGTTLTFGAEDVTVQTPCGSFDGCQLWITHCVRNEEAIFRTYFKEGVGIVKQEREYDGITEVRTLKSYEIKGGSGVLPLKVGNTWEYTADYAPDVMRQDSKFTVQYADGDKATLSAVFGVERLGYDENSFLDMIQQVRNDYVQYDENGDSKLRDVTHAADRALALARTPMEKAHAKAANSVLRRILATDTTFNPAYTEVGCWNFFARSVAHRTEHKITLTTNFRWSFEWKNWEEGIEPLLYNDVYGILQDMADCIWCEDWKPGAALEIEFPSWGITPVKTKIHCEDAGTLETKAGRFDGCLKLSLDTKGKTGGVDYRGGKKDYYFAPGVGIVKMVNYYSVYSMQTVYELTAYEGTGDGYMPLEDGMIRRFEAQDLTDGLVGGVEYSFVKDDKGNVVIFEDRTGVQRKPEKITRYSAVYGEILEEELWKQRNYAESRLRHDVNNFLLLLHFLGRSSRYLGAPVMATAWTKYRMRILETLGEGGDIPPAFLGLYASSCFRAACALFGQETEETKKEGYELLDRSFALFSKWLAIPEGTLLDVGDPLIYGGVKVAKDGEFILLPDGRKEPLPYQYLFYSNSDLMLYGMTAPHGWEWFNSVREEERFKAAIERARELAEN